MKINHIDLKNFRCFQNLSIDFGKITLLTGSNSSGKSSLIYSLLAVLQSEGFPFELSPYGDFVNMGNFKNMVLGHDLNLPIDISFSFKSNNRNKIIFKTNWINNILNGTPFCKFFEYDNGEDKLTIEFQDDKLLFTNEKNETSTYNSINDLNCGLETWYGESIFLYKDFKTLRNYHFNYISSYRKSPSHDYNRIPKAGIVKSDGDGFDNVICEWIEQKSSKYYELLNSMKELELFSNIKIKTKELGKFELQIQTKENGIISSLPDVGFGVSKLLPVIVADIQLEDESIFAISEPEIDLHPSIQANFANYLVKQIKNRNKQYIIETHSEYLLNRIRLLIATGLLNEDDVNVYYFENDGNKSTTTQVYFKKNGEIVDAPDNFFKTYLIDTMQLTMNTFDFE